MMILCGFSAAFCIPCRILAAASLCSAALMPDNLKLLQWFHHLSSATLSELLLFHWVRWLCFHLKSRNIIELFVFCIIDLLWWCSQPALDLLDSLSTIRPAPDCPDLGTAVLQQTEELSLFWVNICHIVCYVMDLLGAETGNRAYLHCTAELGAKVTELMPTKIALHWETT